MVFADLDQCGSALFGVSLVLGEAAESIRKEGRTSGLAGKTRLTSTEITHVFSDVIDCGEVQNQHGISAENHWHSDGNLVSRCWTEASDASDKGAVKLEIRGR